MSPRLTKEMIDACLSHFSEDEVKDILEAEKSEAYSDFPSNMTPKSRRSKRRSSGDKQESDNL